MGETLVLVLLVSVISPAATVSKISPRAQTHHGIYVGQQTRVNDIKVNTWYGIPYAQQPVGNLRWMPPQALTESDRISEAYTPTVCPQRSSYGLLMTESCLTLNVHAPENANNLPVYVWIHGGSFTSGAGAEYNASSFVSTSASHSLPIVVVTINYRLGLLGFLADQGLYDERSGMSNRSTTGNYGILDQIMALDWIKKNIAGFGGNPEQITIGGESAGGISVTILLTSPLVANGTFQRAIVESGGIWPNDAYPLKMAINASGSILRATVNCTTVQCLRNLTVDQVLEVQRVISTKNIFGAASGPVIDDYALTDIMENEYARGKFQRVPILVGINTNETSLFTCRLFNGTANSTQVQAFFNSVYNAVIVSAIPKIYGPITAYDNPMSYLNTVFSNSWVHCGSRRIASRFSSYGLPAYLYTYNHLLPVAPPCFGVAHAAELPMLFPNLLPQLYPNYNFTASEQQLSTNMMLYWANFISTSNPNYSGSPANWNAYLASSDDDFLIDINPQMRNYFYNFTCSGFWDSYAVTNSTIILPEVRYSSAHHYF